MSATLFELEAVVASVPGRTLLHPLTLALAPGRVVGLIGHNGSGKSTLLKLMARQLIPSAGTIRFEGRPLAAWKARAFARRLAYLPQQTPAAPGLLVRELVALGRYPWHGMLGRFGAGDREAVEDAMAQTGVADFAGQQVDMLSGGERQRVWLAMLLAQRPGALLLDEPTSALDIAHQVEVLTLIRRLSREHGLGVVIVLHDVNMAASVCDELLALHSGRLIARGAPDAVMTPATLERIYGLPFGVMPHPVSGRPLGYVAQPVPGVE
ncbi:ATP-binding cassette domain-containing protein [Azospirillum sp. A29]|jgi:iron complex transport system ATP-binding protein|uniref:ABC transporter ATP-binding protein n=1 Tax=Azospirillum sp. A29 TaxID=3160606 RepID=UPI00367261B4